MHLPGPEQRERFLAAFLTAFFLPASLGGRIGHTLLVIYRAINIKFSHFLCIKSKRKERSYSVISSFLVCLCDAF